MKKRALLLGIIALLATSLIGCSNGKEEAKEDTQKPAEKKVIQVATTGQYFPFSYLENEKVVGFDIDVWEEIGKRLGKEIEWTTTSFDGMFGMLESGKVDSVASQVAVTDDRKDKYDFSEIYAYTPYKICVSGENTDINCLEDLYGKSMSLPASCSSMEFLKKVDPEEKIERKVYDFAAGGDIYKDTEIGRVVAITHSVVNFEQAIKEGNYNLKLVGDVLFQEENAFPFRKDDESKKLKAEVDKVIKEMREDGTLKELSEKWFGFDSTTAM